MGRQNAALALLLVATACGGSSETASDTTASQTAPTTTRPSPTATTTDTPGPTPPPRPVEPTYYVGASDIPRAAIEGWDFSSATFIHDDEAGVSLGWHVVLTHPSCDRPAPPGAADLLDTLELDDVPTPYCEVELQLDQIWLSSSDTVSVDRNLGRYESGPLTRTTTAYWDGPDGVRQSATRELVREDVEINIDVEGDTMAGQIETAQGNLGVEGSRAPWPHPYTLELGERFLQLAAAWTPEPPDVEPLPEAPPTGLKVVWFECVLPENEGDAVDRVSAIRSNENCRLETDEAQVVANALGWDLEVVTYRPGNHGAQPGYPNAVAAKPDVIIARGGLGGQWTDVTIAGLQADGVMIVDNRIDDDVGGRIDKTVLPSIDWIDQPSTAPFLETWVAVDAGYQAVAGVSGILNLEAVCGGCQRHEVERPPDIPPIDSLDAFLTEHPTVTHMLLGWGDISLREVLNERGFGDVKILGEGAGAVATEVTPIGNHAWRVFDVVVRTLVTGEIVQTEYQVQPPRLAIGTTSLPVDGSFRQAYLDAWGL